MTRLVAELLVEGGGVVRRRLAPGNPGRIVAADPVAYARDLASAGVGTLFLCDLDGWVAGAPRALAIAQSIVDATGVELWYRGGLTMPGAVESARTHGVSLVVLDLHVLREAAFLRYALDSFGSRVAVALDAHGIVSPPRYQSSTPVASTMLCAIASARGAPATQPSRSHRNRVPTPALARSRAMPPDRRPRCGPACPAPVADDDTAALDEQLRDEPGQGLD